MKNASLDRKDVFCPKKNCNRFLGSLLSVKRKVLRKEKIMSRVEKLYMLCRSPRKHGDIDCWYTDFLVSVFSYQTQNLILVFGSGQGCDRIVEVKVAKTSFV